MRGTFDASERTQQNNSAFIPSTWYEAGDLKT
jgi:hypothetical protein